MGVNKRERHRKGLSGLYLPLYDALCMELPTEWDPTDGLRTFIEQDALWMKGRVLTGERKVTNAKAGESPHNYGMASDWCLWREGFPFYPDLEKQHQLWGVYQELVEKLGLRWGGDWKDAPHNELRISGSFKWRECLPHYEAGGQEAVEEFIRGKLE